MSEINIAFGIDAPFLPHLGALIHSIVRNAPGARFRFIILHGGVSDARMRLLEGVASGHRFYWAYVTDSDVPKYARNAHFSRAILYRLGLETLAPQDCERVLYIDTDTIVLGDVRSLWATELNGAPLAAVMDGHHLDGTCFAKDLNLPPNATGYFNSGVVLFDLRQMRSRRWLSAAIELVADKGQKLRFADQDALNIVAWGQWQPLPPRWNAQRDMVIPTLAARLPTEMQFDKRLPDLVHYTGPEKPWLPIGYHPWAWLYWRYLTKTPFAQEVASTYGMTRAARFRLWLRWLRRYPSKHLAQAHDRHCGRR